MPRPIRSLVVAVGLAAGVASALSAQNNIPPNAGAYLAGRHAQIQHDFRQAATYITEAMLRDGANPALLETLAGAFLSLGEFERADTIAQRFLQTGQSSQIANLILIGDRAQDGEWSDLLTDLDAGQSVGPLFDQLVNAWALIGDGQVDAGLEAFGDVSGGAAVQAFGLYHRMLALGSLGRFEEAAAIPADSDGLQLTRRGITAHVQILSQLGRFDDATAVLDGATFDNLDPALSDLRRRIEAKEVMEFTIAPDATSGIAEVAFSIANALSNEVNYGYTLLYTRLVEALRPGHTEAILLSALLLDRLEQFDLASETYAKIDADDPSFTTAELGRAEVMRKSGKEDAAIEVMMQLSRTHPDNSVVHVTLGDALREMDRFADARDAYNKAIALFDSDTTAQWIVYFTRAITYERTGDWDEAEADFRKALDLQPDQPTVLNYLGYSLVERKEKLDEALDMIERAVAARPDSGFIVDSLGWVLYRLGRYDEAVEPMERAVELMPVDPVVNDHLGDVYWAVGRTLEAQFQWMRALSFVENDQNDEVEPDRIRRKLEVGLDVVLEEEGADPLKVANDG